MQNTNFNWYPVDPYGKIWRFVYYFDKEDMSNYAKIEVAEVHCNHEDIWYWKFLKNNLFHSIISGFSNSRDEAMSAISSRINY